MLPNSGESVFRTIVTLHTPRLRFTLKDFSNSSGSQGTGGGWFSPTHRAYMRFNVELKRLLRPVRLFHQLVSS